MKRRNLLAGSAAILSAAPVAKFNIARAGTAPDPNRLTQDLTPFGAERAGNASGTIPAWTGGITAPPPGFTPGGIPPDLFADDKPLYTITQANMAQYADMLCEGQKKLLTEYGAAGYKMNVYQTRRTAAAPQYIYDNIAKNVTSVQPVAEGLINGFFNAYGGTPFPILSDDPNIAGMQAIWNHNLRWNGVFSRSASSNYVVGNGQVVLTSKVVAYYYYPHNVEGATLDQNNSTYFITNYVTYLAPPNLVGGRFLTSVSNQPLKYPNTAYEYLVGEGRVREAPQTQYDIPNSFSADQVTFDEAQVFNGAIDRYTWKLVGKKEMLIAYNNHSMFASTPEQVFGLQYMNPDLVRWEVHRCNVIEATLAPGKRHTMPFRRFYADEDTQILAYADCYDAQGNLWRFDCNFFTCDARLPASTCDGQVTYNFESGNYTSFLYFYADWPGGINYDPVPVSTFTQQSLVNDGGL